eukprot:2101604-Pleurochrysis_carterae.AAC.2
MLFFRGEAQPPVVLVRRRRNGGNCRQKAPPRACPGGGVTAERVEQVRHRLEPAVCVHQLSQAGTQKPCRVSVLILARR